MASWIDNITQRGLHIRVRNTLLEYWCFGGRKEGRREDPTGVEQKPYLRIDENELYQPIRPSLPPTSPASRVRLLPGIGVTQHWVLDLFGDTSYFSPSATIILIWSMLTLNGLNRNKGVFASETTMLMIVAPVLPDCPNVKTQRKTLKYLETGIVDSLICIFCVCWRYLSEMWVCVCVYVCLGRRRVV